VTRFTWGALALAALTSPALAGPPYLTDDPVPTDTGHWEIYAFAAVEGRHSALDADAGLDLNYGAVKGVQLTATLPLNLTHDHAGGWDSGAGDLEIGVKYRFFDDVPSGWSAAVFPRVILPTSTLDDDGKTRVLLPLWVQKEMGATSVFGGGGYEINPGAGNRDFWLAALAVTRDLSEQVSLGAEVALQGADTDGGTTQARAGLGAIVQLGGPFALLLSGGPSWADRQTSYRAYSALSLNF